MTTIDSGSDEEVTFTFEGRLVVARRGQSVASAVMASGTTILTRSFKYRRPRGYTCGYDVCGNCPVTLNGLQGVSSCTALVQGGEEVCRERGWPSADRDVMRIADLMSRFLSAGFQFKLFRSQPRLAHLAEKAIAVIAGAGRFPTPEAAKARRTRHEAASPDVLVVGGGLSGCAAALGAASSGASVILVHRGPLGGRGRARPGSAVWGGQRTPVAELTPRLADAVESQQAITVLDGTAMSWFDGGMVPIVAGDRLIDVQPSRTIVATGSYDVPGLFPGNDKPGVVLADGVSKMLRVERVTPWQRAVVLTDGARGDAIAAQLTEAGVRVVAIVDQSEEGQAASGRLLGRVVAARGFRAVRAVDVKVANMVRTFRADLLCVALTERPADDLVLQWHYANAGTTTTVTGGWAATSPAGDLMAVGSAAGWTVDDPERAHAEGAAVGRSMKGQRS